MRNRIKTVESVTRGDSRNPWVRRSLGRIYSAWESVRTTELHQYISVNEVFTEESKKKVELVRPQNTWPVSDEASRNRKSSKSVKIVQCLYSCFL